MPMFSSRSFIVSDHMFRSLIHFEFIFVYGVRKCSSFIHFFFLETIVHFIHYKFLKKEAKIYNGEKTISLTSGGGKTGQPLVKQKN